MPDPVAPHDSAPRPLVCLGVAALALASCAPDHPPRLNALPDGVTAELIAEGRELFGKQMDRYFNRPLG